MTMLDLAPQVAGRITGRGAELLDELDTLIADLSDVLAEQDAARLVIADAEVEMSVIEASITLSIEGKNETARKALIVLALCEDAGYQTFAAAVREARATLLSAERRAVIVKQRIALVRAALALLTDGG